LIRTLSALEQRLLACWTGFPTAGVGGLWKGAVGNPPYSELWCPTLLKEHMMACELVAEGGAGAGSGPSRLALDGRPASGPSNGPRPRHAAYSCRSTIRPRLPVWRSACNNRAAVVAWPGSRVEPPAAASRIAGLPAVPGQAREWASGPTPPQPGPARPLPLTVRQPRAATRLSRYRRFRYLTTRR